MDNKTPATLEYTEKMNLWVGWWNVHFEGFTEPNAPYFPGMGWDMAYLPKDSVDAAFLMVEMESGDEVYTPSWEWLDDGFGNIVLHTPVGWSDPDKEFYIHPIQVVHPNGRVISVYPITGAWIRV